MKIADILRMSLGSLWKRKFRTVLTILGVIIGTISVVVMVSLGLGMEKTMLAQVESFGSLTLIEVTEKSFGGNNTDDDDVHLSDEMLQTFLSMDHVETVVPMIQTSAILKCGRYEAYSDVRGLTPEGFEKLGIQIGEGEFPKKSSSVEMFFGNTFMVQWYNPKNNEYPYYETGELADVDLMNDAIFAVFDIDNYYSAGGEDSNGQIIPAPKKYMVNTSGIMAGTIDDWSVNAHYAYMDMDSLKSLLQKVYKNRPIPNQPVRKNGKPYKEIFYSTVYVYADDMENVTALQKQINDMGFDAYADAEWIESEMQSMKSTQTMLGGIGLVSLVVAAIGIVNTMMMSIYERTKEIGVMKVIGCSIKNIQALFLLEATYIGFIGGAIGVGLSYLVSSIINKTFAGDGMMMVQASTIPPWLAILGVVFATIIGMLAGLIPSFRAMKLSPLEAMRT